MTPDEPVPADLDALLAWCEHGHACTEVARLRAEAAALRTALGTFGVHHLICKALVGRECDCGLSAALAGAQPEPPPTLTP